LLKRSGLNFAGYVEFCYACIARVYTDAKRFDDSLLILTEAEAITKDTLVPDPAGLAAIYYQMALAYGYTGRTAESRAALDKAEASLRDVAPNELHPNFVYIYILKSAFADKSTSLAYRLRALEIAEKAFPYKIGNFNNAMQILIGDVVDGEAESIKVQVAYNLYAANVKRTIGDDEQSVEFIDAVASFALNLVRARAFGIAMPYLRTVINLTNSINFSSDDIAISYFMMAQLLHSNPNEGSDDETERYYGRAIELYEDQFGIKEGKTQDVRKKYIRFLLDRKRMRDAARLRDEFIERLRATRDDAVNGMVTELKNLK
jgi:tetratricopeptide (TPR) repeat protein